MNSGFIKLHRQLIDWEWFTDIKTCHLFIYILCRANWEDDEWRGHKIPRGSFITSLAHISDETGLSIQEIRTSLKKLKNTKSLTYKSTNQFTQIYVIKWEEYQCYEELTNIQINNPYNKRTTNDQQQIRNIKKYKNKEIYIDRLPVYDDSDNPVPDEERMIQLMKEKNVS